METKSIYSDIAKRTDGNIYIGVVGPVRTGKSTFIKRFMETLVIPNIESEYRRDRAIDELPQSSAGRTIMTTEPKFIPEEAVRVSLGGTASLNVRLIDCVGYVVPSSLGYFENEAPRMVVTPWFDEEIPFVMAAEVGTRKVITEHSTIGLVVTTDGSIGEIPRDEYAQAEERVIGELKEIDKPFSVLLNCVDPGSESARRLAAELEERYGVPVLPLNCLELTEEDVCAALSQVLRRFPVKEVSVDLPKWVSSLKKEHWLKSAVFGAVREAAKDLSHIGEVERAAERIGECEHVARSGVLSLDLGNGSAKIEVLLKNDLFYKVLGEVTGLEVDDESKLLPCMVELASVKRRYDKVKDALDEVGATGYGIVMPAMEELTLEEPQIMKQGGRYGVKLRASAPSIHMMRADITTEVNPIVGNERQSEELMHDLLEEFEGDPQKIWASNIFGKSLHELVNDGLRNKLYRMPSDARQKLQETIERIINEGCTGLICIIL